MSFYTSSFSVLNDVNLKVGQEPQRALSNSLSSLSSKSPVNIQN